MKLVIVIPDKDRRDIYWTNGKRVANLIGEYKVIAVLPEGHGNLISRSELKKAIESIKQNVEEWVNHTECDTTKALVRISLYEEFIDLIDNAPSVEPKTDILEQIIAEINTSNRGTCDYYIVDRIEEIIDEYQKGGAE